MTVQLKEREETKRKPTIYLSGPMRFSPSGGAWWRDEITKQYSGEYNFIDPRDAHDIYEQDVEIIKKGGDYRIDSEKKQVFGSEVVEKDEEGILESDAVFVGMEDVIARGTVSEICFAYHHDIPVFVWLTDKQEESIWVYDRAFFVDEDYEKVFNAMEVFFE